MEDLRKFYEETIDDYKKSAEDSSEFIKWVNEQIKIEKTRDREFLEYVWSKGVLDELEMKLWGDVKNYEGHGTKFWIKERAKEYNRRNKYKNWIKEWEAKLKEVM